MRKVSCSRKQCVQEASSDIAVRLTLNITAQSWVNNIMTAGNAYKIFMISCPFDYTNADW